jgi:hypothetical protein
MNRVFQVFALCLSIGLLAFLACRAQKPAGAPANAAGDNANPSAGGADAGAAVDAAAAAPEVYFPASKSGGAFLEHQQAPH